MEELKLFTLSNLKDWILLGKRVDGLTEEVITTTRAYAFVNNPFAEDGLPVVATLYVDHELAAYTAAFPEVLVQPEVKTHWFNSLYVSPKFEGKGYGLFVIGSLMESYGDDPVFDLDAVPTSVEILSYLGLQAGTFAQYDFRNKSFRRHSLKGKLAGTLDTVLRFWRTRKTLNALRKRIQTSSYTLKYDTFLDEEAFDFMRRHAEGDLFLRSRDALNWMLRTPFVHEAPLVHRVKNSILFTSAKEWQRYYVVKVYVRNELAGVYILCDSSSKLSLMYLYYDSERKEDVMLSIAEHILHFKNVRFATTNPDVADFVKRYKLYPLNNTIATSICYPASFGTTMDKAIQGGDGDMFLN